MCYSVRLSRCGYPDRVTHFHCGASYCGDDPMSEHRRTDDSGLACERAQRNVIGRILFFGGIRETLHAHHEADYEGSFSEVLSVDCCFVAYLYFPYCDVWTADLPREMGPLCEDLCKQRAVWKAGAASPAIWT